MYAGEDTECVPAGETRHFNRKSTKSADRRMNAYEAQTCTPRRMFHIPTFSSCAVNTSLPVVSTATLLPGLAISPLTADCL